MHVFKVLVLDGRHDLHVFVKGGRILSVSKMIGCYSWPVITVAHLLMVVASNAPDSSFMVKLFAQEWVGAGCEWLVNVGAFHSG